MKRDRTTDVYADGRTDGHSPQQNCNYDLKCWWPVTPRYATKRILIKVASHRTSFESNKDDWLVDYIMYHSHVFLFYSLLNAFSVLNARVVPIMIVDNGFCSGEEREMQAFVICMCDNFQRESDFLSLLEIVVVAYCVLFARLYQLHNNCIINGLTFVDLEEIKRHYHSNMVILNLNWNLLLFISGCIQIILLWIRKEFKYFLISKFFVDSLSYENNLMK